MKKILVVSLLAPLTIPAEAHEASNGAYATWCLAGTVAVHTGLEILGAKTGHRIPAGKSLATAVVVGCPAGVGTLYSLTDHPASITPEESDLKEEPKTEIINTEPFQE